MQTINFVLPQIRSQKVIKKRIPTDDEDVEEDYIRAATKGNNNLLKNARETFPGTFNPMKMSSTEKYWYDHNPISGLSQEKVNELVLGILYHLPKGTRTAYANKKKNLEILLLLRELLAKQEVIILIRCAQVPYGRHNFFLSRQAIDTCSLCTTR